MNVVNRTIEDAIETYVDGKLEQRIQDIFQDGGAYVTLPYIERPKETEPLDIVIVFSEIDFKDIYRMNIKTVLTEIIEDDFEYYAKRALETAEAFEGLAVEIRQAVNNNCGE